MKRSAIDYLVIICFLLALFSLSSVAAQDQQLLINPGFEDPFSVSADDPPREVADGWTRWHVPSTPGAPTYVNSDPEYYEVAPNTARIRSGNNAQLISALYASYNGGVYQTVSGITPGAQLRFTVNAWVWSTTFNEVDLSEEDGDLLISVGIDPAGGTNGESNSIIWSVPIEAYDAYNAYSVDATASGDTVTVFVRAIAGFPVRHNNVYLDDASLTVVGEGSGGTETETVEPTQEVTAEVTATEVASATDEVQPTLTVEPTEEITPEVTDLPTAEPPTAEPSATVAENPLPTEEVSPTDEPPTSEPPTAVVEPTEEITPEVTDVPTAEPFTSTPMATVEVSPTDDLPTAEPPTVVAEPTEEITPEVTDVPTAEPTEGPSATPSFVPPTSTSIPPAASATPVVPTEASTSTSTPLPPPTATALASATPIGNTGGGTGESGQTIRYTVQNGDTVARIAQRFNSTINGIRDANGLNANYLIFVGQELIIPINTVTPATSTPIGNTQPTPVPTATTQAPLPGNTTIYIVQRGDSLYRIAQTFNTTVGTLANLNGIVNVQLLQIGQRLIVPVPNTGPTPVPPQQPRVYVVQYGDTLYRLSLLFGVPIRQIAQANGITQLNLIYVGQRLIIP